MKIKNSNTYKIKLFLIVTLFISFILGIVFCYKLISKDSLSFVGSAPASNLINKNFVTLKGAIKNPGIYEFHEGEVLGDVIQRAGGLSDDADQNSINPNASLKDESEIIIRGNNQNNSNLIDLNTSSLEELETLPGIGESIAKAIIDSRPFQTIEELLDVKGIGEKKFLDIKDLVKIE